MKLFLNYASLSIFFLIPSLFGQMYSQEIYVHKFKRVTYGVSGHIKWIPCHHSVAHPQVADGDGLEIRRVAANILNKQSQTADKG
jgi:hypothetical protein